jgi:hypothetical protein
MHSPGDPASLPLEMLLTVWCRFQIFIINIWSVALFQLIAAVTRDDTIATSVGSFFLLLVSFLLLWWQ